MSPAYICRNAILLTKATRFVLQHVGQQHLGQIVPHTVIMFDKT